MKSLVCSMLVMCAAGLLALGGSSPSAPSPAFASISPSVLEELAKRSPLCDCVDKCKCAEPCLCNTVDEKPAIKAENSPLVDIRQGKSQPLVEEKRFTQPQISPPPGLIVPVAHPSTPAPKPVAKKVAAAPSGHFETRSAGFRGRRSYQVWVPDSAGACSMGQCAAPTYSGFGSCGFGGCSSCGRR